MVDFIHCRTNATTYFPILPKKAATDAIYHKNYNTTTTFYPLVEYAAAVVVDKKWNNNNHLP